MTINEAIDRMKANPMLKMTMPRHYKSHEYNYWDGNDFFTESGTVWNITLSRQCNEIDGWEDYRLTNDVPTTRGIHLEVKPPQPRSHDDD